MAKTSADTASTAGGAVWSAGQRQHWHHMDHMQPVAFVPSVGTLGSISGLRGLSFPRNWYPILHEVQAAATGRDRSKVTPPIRSLNAVLQALLPHLVATPRFVQDPLRRRDTQHGQPLSGDDAAEGGAANALPWLLAREDIAPQLVWAIVQAWLEQTYAEQVAEDHDGFRARLAQARAALRPEDLRWEAVAATLERPLAENGSARLHPLAYTALAALLAERAVANQLTISVAETPCTIAWAPRPQGGVELISWPPVPHIDESGRHYFSYVITLTVQTIPGVAVPRIHSQFSVRRWRGRTLFGADGHLQVPAHYSRAFLRPSAGWMGLPRAAAFAVAEVGACYEGGEGSTRIPIWRNALPAIAARLGVSFPSADAWAADPEIWLRGAQGIELGVVEMWPRGHHVAAGIGPDEVERLTQMLATAFSDSLTLAPPQERMPTQRNIARHPLQTHLQDLPVEQRMAGLRDSVLGAATAAALGKSTTKDITIEVWWATEVMRDLLVDRTLALLTGSRPVLTAPPRGEETQGTAADAAAAVEGDEEEEQDEEASEAGTAGAARDGGDDESDGGDRQHDDVRSQGHAPGGGPAVGAAEMTPAPHFMTRMTNGGGSPRGAGISITTTTTANTPLVRIEQPPAGGQGRLQPTDPADASTSESLPRRVQKPARVRAALPWPQPARGPIVYPLLQGDGAQLVIVPYPLGSYGDPLDPAVPSQRFIDRTLKRAHTLESTVACAQGPTLALVELPDFRDPRPERRQMRARFRQRDPKIALRLGLARTGRVTQFITPPEAEDLTSNMLPTDLGQRASNAVLDGLRQLGFLPAPIGFRFEASGPQLPQDLLVAAVHVLRVSRKSSLSRAEIPVVVLLHTQRLEVLAWLPDGKGVRPYRQALLDVAALEPGAVTRAHRPQHLGALRAFLLHELPALGARDTLILASAQNARSTWPGINNEQLGFDAIRFERDGVLVDVTKHRGRMRLVRLRRADRGETPEWYVPGARPGSSAAGLWHDPAIKRVFYSTSDKLRSMKGGRQGKQTRPQEQYALPSLLEIIPAAVQPEDLDETGEASIWAYAVEQWRRTGYLAPEREMTALPLPLHLAAHMQEYARVLAARAFPEDEETEDDDEDDDETGPFDLIQPPLL